jgi:hypothetical protein
MEMHFGTTFSGAVQHSVMLVAASAWFYSQSCGEEESDQSLDKLTGLELS